MLEITWEPEMNKKIRNVQNLGVSKNTVEMPKRAERGIEIIMLDITLGLEMNKKIRKETRDKDVQVMIKNKKRIEVISSAELITKGKPK